MLNIVFSDQPFPVEITSSLFLEGPSPRNNLEYDWKMDAVDYLEKTNFNGTVFIPVPKDKFYGKGDQAGWTYTNQIAWECKARNVADIIVAWVAREIDREKEDLGMPGFTTNIEFGEDLSSGKLMYGRPDSAKKCNYLDQRYKEIHLPIYNNLHHLLDAAITRLGTGALRRNGEVNVPLFIWNSEQFQSWYKNLQIAGNRLDDAKVLHHVAFGNNVLFCYMLWVKIWIESEQRFKSNEFVFARKDISTVIAYYKEQGNDQIVLIKEFRSPVNNTRGMVYELPGGSSVKQGVDPQENAQHELQEEIGLTITDLARFKYVGQRQLAATLSSHQAQVYKVELTKTELDTLLQYQSNNTVFGVVEDTEQTSIEVIPLNKIFDYPIDYSMLGMIFEAISQ